MTSSTDPTTTNDAPPSAGRSRSEPSLADVRDDIDRLDAALVDLIRDRTRLARMAADSKRASGLALRDTQREVEVVRRAASRARDLGVDDERVREFFWRLIDLSHATVEGSVEASHG